MNPYKQLVAINAKIAMVALHEQSKVLERQISYQQRLVQENCQHVDTTTIRKYYEGGYDYVSSVIVTETCDLCSKIIASGNDPAHKGSHA